MPVPSEKLSVLKKVFGHDTFRPFQEDAIDTILMRRDLLMILPTGGGKSLCYQLPSLLMDGLTIVVSPLLALMHDQVTALNNLGVNAAMISSLQTPSDVENVFNRIIEDNIKLLYVAPERLRSARFMNILGQVDINFFVIDEAHCVSEWGHEFRDDYRKLDLLRINFPGIPIAAFTATATEKVQTDIAANLKLKDPAIFRGPVFRENMKISATYRKGDGRKQLLEIIQNHAAQSGIVYTFTRNAAESLAEFLCGQGIKTRAYHAGLSVADRQKTYHDFIHDEIDVVVATVAFGMGIDKSNIRFVVHISLPKTIENYYQEIGRAGRDGMPANVYLLFSISDMMQRKALVEQLDESPYKNHSFGKLDAMIKYGESELCRHKMLAAYFEDPNEKDMHNCKNRCDNCQAIENPEVSEKKLIDITEASQKFLSAVIRSDQRFGTNYVIDLLRGSKNQKILENRHDNLSVYGIGHDKSKAWWHTIAQRLQELGALGRGEFQELLIQSVGVAILKKETAVSIRSDRLNQTFQCDSKIPKKKQDPSSQCSEFSSQGIFERLRELRTTIAREEQVPAYIVFNDKTLLEMSQQLPQSKEEMLRVGGVAEKKFERYGNRFLELCRKI